MKLIHGDCLDVMAQMEPNSVDAIVTDPPYGLEFMGKDWDDLGRLDAYRDEATVPQRDPDSPGGRHAVEYQSSVNPRCLRCEHYRWSGTPCRCGPNAEWDIKPGTAQQAWHGRWAEAAYRIAKLGAHLVAFGGSRTHHRLMCALEDAGWEIRDTLCWLYGSGFPKSHNLKGEWEGWGTALKPAYEPIVLARKPLIGTVAQNVLEHGTGGLNIDGCRVGTDDNLDGGTYSPGGKSGPMPGDPRTGAALGMFQPGAKPAHGFVQPSGRWPANLVLDEEAAAMLDGQSGELTSGANPTRRGGLGFHGAEGQESCAAPRGTDMGGASRFFYVAKASRAEREAGLEGGKALISPKLGMANDPTYESSDGGHRSGFRYLTRNHHPTVKPVDLMRWLCRLITPPRGLILDPFMGSGTTGVAAALEDFRFVGIEKEAEYLDIAGARIAQAREQLTLWDSAQ